MTNYITHTHAHMHTQFMTLLSLNAFLDPCLHTTVSSSQAVSGTVALGAAVLLERMPCRMPKRYLQVWVAEHGAIDNVKDNSREHIKTSLCCCLYLLAPASHQCHGGVEEAFG